jgi:hypothetical protein
MNTLLVVTTVLSLAATAMMAVVLVRVLREQRRRSDARVEGLMKMAGPAPGDADLDLQVAPDSGASVATLFNEPPHASPWPRRAAIAAALALTVTVAGAAMTWIGRSPDASVTSAQTVGAAPLELLSLKHTLQGETMTIAGLVQNPRAGRTLQRIAATALLFDGEGSFLASGRALLDFTTLAPGDESPFVITVPATSAVARYRIGFRGADGNVIGHVDRRSSTASVARNE